MQEVRAAKAPSCPRQTAASSSRSGAFSSECAEVNVSPLSEEDIGAFVACQDLFVEEHLLQSRRHYPNVSLGDWQEVLIPPKEHARRTQHTAEMLAGESVDSCFKGLAMVKASVGTKGSRQMAGYIMYQELEQAAPAKNGHAKKRRKMNGGGAASQADSGPYTLIRQLFVKKEFRSRGCAKALMEAMLNALRDSKHGEDIRLSVLDLNETARMWYRQLGFRVRDLSTHFLGSRHLFQVVVFEELRWLRGSRKGEVMPFPSIFNQNVEGEVVTVEYPDGSGRYILRILKYVMKEKIHNCDSRNLSLWAGEEFTDVLDINKFYSEGYLTFARPLSLMFRSKKLCLAKEKEQKKLWSGLWTGNDSLSAGSRVLGSIAVPIGKLAN